LVKNNILKCESHESKISHWPETAGNFPLLAGKAGNFPTLAGNGGKFLAEPFPAKLFSP